MPWSQSCLLFHLIFPPLDLYRLEKTIYRAPMLPFRALAAKYGQPRMTVKPPAYLEKGEVSTKCSVCKIVQTDAAAHEEV